VPCSGARGKRGADRASAAGPSQRQGGTVEAASAGALDQHQGSQAYNQASCREPFRGTAEGSAFDWLAVPSSTAGNTLYSTI
jgi:hypothetical protein